MIPKFLKKRIFKAPVATDHTALTPELETEMLPVASTLYTNAPINQLYRKLSGQLLDVAVKPKLLGELPEFDDDDNILRFYVLQDYSRSNSILIDLQTQEHNLPPALVGVQDITHDVKENAAIIFLHHPHAKDSQLSPRLSRLVAAVLQHPELQVRLVPVSILWGRAPEKEDSLFKLLTADNWEDPSITKQLFNIGVMGRDTFVQFHPPQDLRTLIHDSLKSDGDSSPNDTSGTALSDTVPSDAAPSYAMVSSADGNRELVRSLQQQLNIYLDKQRASMLGPDLSDRRNLVDKLVYSPAIKHAIEAEAAASGTSVREARMLAKGYANEMVNDYSHSIVRGFYKFLTWLWTQLYDGVEVHHFERVRELAADYELIYVPCHRSHVDYLLLSYVIYMRGLSIPYVAAGDNLDVPVLGPLLRGAVAFYIRRSFRGNALYTAVLREYMHTLITRNTPIEYFIEGGRSRSGRLLPPKMGMLAMTVHSQLRRTNKPVVFIPTYIGYERIMEGGTYVGELKGKPKESESLIGLLKVGRKIERIFGNVHLSFGTPLHLSDFMQKFDVPANSLPADRTDTPLDDKTSAMVDNIGVKVMQHINKAAVITPVSLLSLVLLSAPKAALDEDICREQIALYQGLAQHLPYSDDTIITDMTPQQIIDYGIKLKLIERIPHILGDIIQVAGKQAALLSYFRNNILHVFILLSFLSALVARNGRIERSRLNSIAEQLYPFLQSELFLYYSAHGLQETLNKKVDSLLASGLIVELSDGMLSVPETNSKCYQQLQVLATPVEQSLERYFMTLALLAQQGSGNLTENEVVDLCHLLGQRLSVLYADDIPDFFDRALFTSFIGALIRLDYLQKDEETGILTFDQRIDNIAHHAKYVLSPDMMQILQQVASLNEEEIAHAITEISNKKQRKFGRKRS
ncbi:glycerol-3-phosphate 1-O-acyltransferase PlsB [Psychrobacter sp. Sarcosine-02u-2]|jgi:glycerol-3-phosphate O-acyltransferase|uniref:glycerol-3-phosphate 1-O-acyltransferase PlsB n=1 Tax=Psychrobacter sp. Sarcosine-02u-2 TaxID=2058324 RepID=UPI000C7ADC9E|nr:MULTISPECIES: glycerol-3-phosphate 1-O-acyltransferase PlsB [unclassified Psychrobacter]MCG3860245.1 glycerol-3-phosphate 1-O-acyltransferase PlsB [Psychrobacter sp. Ps5]PKG82693.1 glycerol-3-phosphate 1-O-acyltransferase PlsB [Psychrobacter sp. Sarcosine-02u-2]